MSRHLAAILLLFSIGIGPGLAGCSGSDDDAALKAPEIQQGTAEEREEAIDALRTTWRRRPMETTLANRQAERRFLSRTCSFLFRIKNTDEFASGCVLWNECIHDYTRQYGDPNR
jgi:hypothetical protein